MWKNLHIEWSTYTVSKPYWDYNTVCWIKSIHFHSSFSCTAYKPGAEPVAHFFFASQIQICNNNNHDSYIPVGQVPKSQCALQNNLDVPIKEWKTVVNVYNKQVNSC